MQNPLTLEDKTALITGGGTGIGLGIAEVFIQNGAKVIITGRREEVLRQASEKLGVNASYEVFDVTQFEKIPAFVNHLEDVYGPIDILVNNAGQHLKKYATETSDDEFLKIIESNLLAVFSLTRECAKHMLPRRQGSILLVSSMAGLFGIDRVVAYSASKTGILGMMRTLVTEFSEHGVRINAIAPGWIHSPMMENALNADPQRKAKTLGRIPMKKFGEPHDIGYAALYLSSGASKYVTGVVLPVDGGAADTF